MSEKFEIDFSKISPMELQMVRLHVVDGYTKPEAYAIAFSEDVESMTEDDAKKLRARAYRYFRKPQVRAYLTSLQEEIANKMKKDATWTVEDAVFYSKGVLEECLTLIQGGQVTQSAVKGFDSAMTHLNKAVGIGQNNNDRNVTVAPITLINDLKE